jgi:NAD(P)-dependent dehydrogenase (short-subunit alcohol dehydrogenase family)
MGRATVTALAAAGATAVGADLEPEGEMLLVDVASESSVAAAVEAVVERHGRLDGLANYAGVLQPHAPLEDLDVEVWDRMFSVHARGAFLCVKQAARVMEGSGAIVLVSSMGGISRYGVPDALAYCAAKAAVIQLALSAAPALGARGIRVNVIAPGYVATPMGIAALGGTEDALDLMAAAQPIRRAGRPEDIARLAAFLLSNHASWLTGMVLNADGGFTTLGGRTVERLYA